MSVLLVCKQQAEVTIQDKPVENNEYIRTLQLGMSWFPEQAGNGLDRVYHALTQHLPRAGVGVRGLVAGSAEVARTSGGGVQAFAPETASLPGRLWALRQHMRRAVRSEPVDLVAAHFALYTVPVLDLMDGRPLVVHFHGPWAGESEAEEENPLVVKMKAALERVVYRRGARFIVLSDAFRRVLTTRYGVAEEHVRVVPGGVEVDRFDTGLSREEARRRLGWPAGRPIVLSVRRLARRMGLENLIEAMAEVRRRVPEALLFIAGKGPLAGELGARIAAAGLEQHVKLLGFVPEDELPLAYRAATLSVVPTVALEGFGLITVESLAAGTPVLVTPVGGLPEVVRGLDPALIFSDARPAALSNRLVEALHERLSLPSSEACQRYTREHFDWPVIAAETRAVYEEVLA